MQVAISFAFKVEADTGLCQYKMCYDNCSTDGGHNFTGVVLLPSATEDQQPQQIKTNYPITSTKPV